MRYYAKYNDSGDIILIGTGYGGTEITEAEYNRLLSEIREKADYTDKLYNNEITIDDVPTEWREEIQQRVDERIEQDANIPESEKIYGVSEDIYNSIIDDYTLSLIEGGLL